MIWRKINPDSEMNLVHDAGFEHDIAKRIPATDKAREILGFTATTSLDEMLDLVIPWIREAIARKKI
jgi:nucleoside-diphosphate-sugar epimerase